MNKNLKKTLSIILTILMIATTMPFAFAADVNLVINMTDRNNNGWAGNAIQVGTVSGGVFTKITDATVNSGKTATYEAVISDESVYAFKWTKGSFADQCSFNILIDGETVFEAYGCSNYATDELIYIWCKHSITDGICSICGLTCGVDFAHTIDSDGNCSVCGVTLCNDHSYTNHYCKTCGYAENGYRVGYCGASTNDGGAESVTWTLDSKGLLTISGTGAIASSSFYRNKNIKTVLIEKGVTSIGNYAFNDCINLASVTIGNDVTSIGMYAFVHCESLESITIGDGVTSIGEYAFNDCTSLESITIGDGVKSIGNNAFYDCTSLESITIGNGVTSMGNNVFLNCESLTSVSVPCKWNGEPLYSFDSSVEVTVDSHTAPEASDCTKGYACTVCEQTVEAVDKHSFVDGTCTACGTKTGTCGANGDNVIWTLDSAGVLTLRGTGAIADYSFNSNTDIKTVVIEYGVTSIGDYAFNDCTSLTLVHYLGTSNQWYEIEIGSYGNDALTDATRHYCAEKETTVTCTEDGYTAGWYCAACAEYFVGGEETTALGHDFVDGTCKNCGGTCETLGYHTFEDGTCKGCEYECEHSFENGTCKACGITGGYCGASTNDGGEESVTWTLDSAGVLTISGTGAMKDYLYNGSPFYKNSDIKTVVIEKGVTSIGTWAFYNCTSLESIEIPDSVIIIGDDAFDNCTSLTSIKIPDSVTSIGEWAFAYCTNLESVTIPDSVTSIVDAAFRYCIELTLVHYLGTSEQWDKIEIASYGNEALTDATRHYCTEKEAIDVTCTEAGYTAGWYCADCEEYVVGGEETAALGHDYDVTKSENNLTRPTLLSLAPGIAGLIDGGWLDGYYTYTCKNGCGTTTTETAKRADYTAFDTAMNDYDAIVNDESVLDSVKNELRSIYQQNADVTGGDRIETEQAEVDAVVRLLSEKVDEIKAAIEDGTAIKADYTAIDEAIEAIDEALENATISEEMANELADIKADLEELKENKNATMADVNALLDRAEAITETMDNCAKGTHSFTDYTESAEAKCGVAGKEEATCDNGCGATDENAIPALEHVDKDGDYVCDNRCGYEFEKPVDLTPDTPDEPTDNNCDHLCHSDNAFIQFVWKIISFLQRLFGIQQYCDCGVLHYDNPVFG